jgi:hypothetical protein
MPGKQRSLSATSKVRAEQETGGHALQYVRHVSPNRYEGEELCVRDGVAYANPGEHSMAAKKEKTLTDLFEDGL